MSVQDMIKKSVLESGMFSQYDIPKILAALAVALILGSVIYLVYQKFYVGVIFSRSFAVTLVGMTVLTCMVTLAISSNIVISLGMVGALSIVRFRTAIKDPMDLLYLFWAITSGITAGAGMYALTLLTAVIIILMITLFYHKQQNGRIYISHILDSYGVNYSICSNISIGEDAGNINNGLLIAISELESEYERNIKLFLKSSMWIGQISMILIAMKPMIDIMILVSVGPLNFKL